MNQLQRLAGAVIRIALFVAAAGQWERALLLVAALLLIKPGWITDVVGLVLLGVVAAVQWPRRQAGAAQSA